MGFRKDADISDETIIGYILGSLPDEEMSFIEDQLLLESLTGKSTLAQRLIDLRGLLRPVEIAHTEQFEPSNDLTDRTLRLIQGQQAEPPLPSSESKGVKPIAWLDSLATVAVCMVAISLVLPAMWRAREQARKIGCADKLRSLGLAMHSFSNMRSDGEFPKVAPVGNLSFAGVYAIRLKDAHLIQAANQVWCPTNSFARTVEHLPTIEAYSQSSPEEQIAWRRTVGGTYAYNLGYLSDGNYRTPSSREGFRKPLIGDFVYLQEDSTAALRAGLRSGHGYDSANIVFTDGQVATIKLIDLESAPGVDHPYLNDDRQRGAGVGLHDACLAPSFVSPFNQTIQEASLPFR